MQRRDFRGLGVEFVVSDDHVGLRSAIALNLMYTTFGCNVLAATSTIQAAVRRMNTAGRSYIAAPNGVEPRGVLRAVNVQIIGRPGGQNGNSG